MAETSNKNIRIIINSTHDKLRDQWRTAKDPGRAWVQHISNTEELERYAAAVIHREERMRAREQALGRLTPTEWCYKELQKYFRGGEKETRRNLEYQVVARQSPQLLSSHYTSNSDAAAAAAMRSRETSVTVAEELPRSQPTLIEEVSAADDQSAQAMQGVKKGIETRIFTDADSEASMKSASGRILSDKALAANVNVIVDSEMTSISTDVPKVDSLHNKSQRDNFRVKDFTSNGDSFAAKESMATTPFAVASTKAQESSSRAGDSKKLTDGTLENSVSSPTQSSVCTDTATFQTSDSSLAGDRPRLRVLDVGSCFNPFKVYSDLDVVALDLLPATKDTFQCNFLELIITERNEAVSEAASFLPGAESLHDDIPDEGAASTTKILPSCRKITSLPANSFDAVIFSSLLSYLPCPKQRLLCCKHAYRLIKPEGLLVVAELDIRGGKRYGFLFESWYIALSSLGFSRVKYQKSSTFHGMLFRKGLYPEAYKLRTKSKIDKLNQRKHNMIISQPKSESLVYRNQQIKNFDLDKALSGLWLWHNIADVRQQEVMQMNKNRRSGKTPARSSKPKVDNRVELIFTCYLRSFMGKIKRWIRGIRVTKNDS